MTGRKGEDPLTKPDKVLRFAGKGEAAVGETAVIERPDADGIPGCDELVSFTVIENQGELRIQHPEHLQPVFPVERQEQLAVGIALKHVALCFQLQLLLPPAVELTVTDDLVLPQGEGLHPFIVQAHDRETMETEETFAGGLDPRIVRPPALGAVEIGPDLIGGIEIRQETHNTTHNKNTSE